MSRRARLGFVAGCLLVFGLIAALITWTPFSKEPSSRTPATVTLAPGATPPAGFKPEREPIEKFNEILHPEGKLVPKYTCVKTQDLKDKGDQLHYDTASARELGKRYAAAMLELQK